LAILLFTPNSRQRPNGTRTPARALAGLPATDALSSSQATEVERWLESRVGYRVDVPLISEAHLKGGLVLDDHGVATAAVTYRLHGKPLTYLAVPTARIMGRPVDNADIEMTTVDGLIVATWTERGTARAVMAPIPEGELATVARECKKNASAS
jgi:anti-sigma factor RsiW